MSCGRRSVRMSTASDFSRPPSRFHLHLLAPTPQLSSTTFTNFAGILVGTPGADWTSVSAKILSLSHFAAFGPPLVLRLEDVPVPEPSEGEHWCANR
jgi:hypothetical protein